MSSDYHHPDQETSDQNTPAQGTGTEEIAALSAQLRAMVPPPRDGYWESIDASLSGADRGTSNGSEEGVSAQQDMDTDDNVIRLTDMSTRNTSSNRTFRTRILLAVAAAFLLGLGAVFALTRSSSSPAVDSATDLDGSQSEQSETDSTTTTSLDTESVEEDTGAESSDDEFDTADPVAPVSSPSDSQHSILMNSVYLGSWDGTGWNRTIPEDPSAFDGVEVQSTRTFDRNVVNRVEQTDVCFSPDGPRSWQLQAGDQWVDGLAISNADWDLAPRDAVEITPAATHRDVVVGLLASRGVTDPSLQNLTAHQIDLEGDGVNEVVLAASFGEPDFYGSRIGDFSILILRRVIGDGPEVDDIVLGFDATLESDNVQRADEIYPDAAPDILLEFVNVFAFDEVADLNGDGVLELAISAVEYESGSYLIIDPTSVEPRQPVLELVCGA